MGKAPLSNCLTSLFATQSHIQQSFTLPLLYHTRTLLSDPKTARRLEAASSNAHSHERCRRTFSTSVQCQFSRSNAWQLRINRASKVPRYRAGNTKGDPISFINPNPRRPADDFSPFEDPEEDRLSRPSTVTKSEQAAFDKLLRDFPGSRDDTDEILDPDELNAVYVDLDTIFEDAIAELRMKREEAAAGDARKIHLGSLLQRERAIDSLVWKGEGKASTESWRLFKRPLLAGTSLEREGSIGEVSNEEERARLEVACDDHKTMVMRMFESANSDVEIWRVLEEEVFNLITHLDEHIKLVEKATKRHAAKVRKAEAEDEDSADTKLEKRRLKKDATASVKLTETKAIPVDNLLAILNRNYAEYCLHAHRLLRRKHPTSSYGPQILATIKRRGPISYVLGVTTDIYNEVLFYQWTQYSDLHGMADTIEEMMNQGIEGNEVTIALIKGIAKQRRMGRRRAFSPPVMRQWWTMRGTVEGWKRMIHLFGRIVRSWRKAQLRASTTGSETGELETETK